MNSKEHLYFIQSEQRPNGSFISTNNKHTTFYTSLIVEALKDIDDPISVDIKTKAVDFLLKEQYSDGSWNYWQKESSDYKSTPYPNDLDDTFAALLAIHTVRPSVIDEKMWVKIVNILTESETSVGGPYYTWITPHSHRSDLWNNTDIVVNCTVARFLKEYSIALPKVQAFFDTAITDSALQSSYYHKEVSVIYFLSKAYDGNYKNILIRKILEKRNNDSVWDTPLENAHAITALLNLGFENSTDVLTPAVQHLLLSRRLDLRDNQDLFIESKNANSIMYSGCDAYTSACCIEALHLYYAANKDLLKNNKKESEFVETVFQSCTQLFTECSEEMQQQFQTLCDSIKTKDPSMEIILLPFYFAQNMHEEIPQEKVHALAMANLLGWIGYSIKDSLMDREPVEKYLPCATLCIRKCISLFQSVTTDSMLIESILDGIEEALLWEYLAYDLNKTVQSPFTLAEIDTSAALKSFGHALGPLILCEKEDQDSVRNFFMQYLIARQLHDDAHDWQEDLEKGFANSVSISFVKNNRPIKITREDFWNFHIDTICEKVFDHIAKARVYKQKITSLKDSDFLDRILIPLEQSCFEALRERDKAKRFFEACEITQ
ncbi:MAG TPA: prenyltransferase/squalene oxidase repeat-containing protein [Candidatus Paceibacterota bacterium]|jgi:hypothetical protein|nr:prenyltransferase/squalene oxidase repeat-containing protein [Candidatus Paceibacterota bacterium]